MKLASLIGCCAGLYAGIVVAGCGGSSTTSPSANQLGSSGGGYDATAPSGEDAGSNNSNASSGGNSNGTSSGGSNSTSSGGGTACPSSCASDSDCQSACPAVSNGGTNCCDTTSSTCFSTPMAACPAAGVGGE